MHSIWTGLIWKEWREFRWTTAALCLITIAVPAAAGVKEPDAILRAMAAMLAFTVPIASIFVGMQIAAGEHARGTIRLLQALPVGNWKIAAVKLCAGAVTIITPIVAGVAFTWLWHNWRGAIVGLEEVQQELSVDLGLLPPLLVSDNVYAGLMIPAAVAGVSVMLWMAAGGVNQSDEVRAGAIGFLVMLLVWATILLIAYFGARANENSTPPSWLYIITPAAPGGSTWMASDGSEPRAGYGVAAVAVGLLSHGLLAAWFALRFGRRAPVRRQTVELSRIGIADAWLRPPRSGRATAILWKQARETLPLAVLGMALVLVGQAIVVLVNRRDATGPAFFLGEFVGVTLGLTMTVAFFLSIVSGIGLVMDDLRPGYYAFWRSRPINIDQWFLLKFSSGLAITLLILSVPMLAVVGYAAIAHEGVIDANGEGTMAALVGLMVLAGLYSGAVTTMTLVRQPIFAAALTFGGLFAIATAMDFFAPEFTDGAALFGSLLAIIGLIVALGWIAIRKNWGWKP